VRNRLEHVTDKGTGECGWENVKRMREGKGKGKGKGRGREEDIIKKKRRTAGGKGVFY